MTVTITPQMLTPSEHLLTETTLGTCTTRDGDVVTKAPWTLSSGEELLWAVLAGINGAGAIPSDEDLRARLDGPSLDACWYALGYRAVLR